MYTYACACYQISVFQYSTGSDVVILNLSSMWCCCFTVQEGHTLARVNCTRFQLCMVCFLGCCLMNVYCSLRFPAAVSNFYVNSIELTRSPIFFSLESCFLTNIRKLFDIFVAIFTRNSRMDR